MASNFDYQIRYGFQGLCSVPKHEMHWYAYQFSEL